MNKTMRKARGFVAAAVAALGLAAKAGAVDITGAGATFPYPIYAQWAQAYKDLTGVRLNYQSIGSGGGIKQILAKTVGFGASDMPLKPEELARGGLTQFPTVVGGEVLVANVPGIHAGDMILDGATIAKIYLGRIAYWDDGAIVALNPGLALPHMRIGVVHRSDGSGTTFIFTDYLSKTSPEWRGQVGEGTAVEWPLGVGGKGNEGVANYAAQMVGAIGYVEYAYAIQNHLAYAKLVNRAGTTVEPGIDTFQAAAANADWENAPAFYMILTDQPGARSWPITGATFILMHQRQDDPVRAQQTLDFFDWAYKNGGAMAEQLAYVPLPANVISLIQRRWQTIVGPNGVPVWTPSRS